MNRLVIEGNITEIEALRHTPAGVPMMGFRIAHASEQIEAGRPRKVECELQVVALGQSAIMMGGARPGEGVKLTGFLAAKGNKSRQPVLHIEHVEFLEGTNNGF